MMSPCVHTLEIQRMLIVIKWDIKIRYVHSRCYRWGSHWKQHWSLSRERRDTHTLKYTKITHKRTNRWLDQMGSSAKFHDDGRAPSWALYGHGIKRIDERPISMMTTELPLGLSMILDRKTPGCAPGTSWKWNYRRVSDLHDNGRAPSWALHSHWMWSTNRV